jgi:hypothetical protein
MDVEVSCPSCGETLVLRVDPTGGARVRYVEDCEVCCGPFEVDAIVGAGEDVQVRVRRLDD